MMEQGMVINEITLLNHLTWFTKNTVLSVQLIKE